MVMGKGGVGKTTIAASIAAELASRGHHVHLSTTDPAAHVAATLAGEIENLQISRIDPVAETKAYVDRVMATRGARTSTTRGEPCWRRISARPATRRSPSSRPSRGSSRRRDRASSSSTRPRPGTPCSSSTRPGSYHRQMVGVEPTSDHADVGRIVTPLMKLRDPQYTKILLVTLAETTPVSEAARLQADLRRAQIEPFGWVINSSLAAAGSTDPCLKQRVAAELEQIDVVRERHAHRIAIVPWMTRGAGRPRSLARAGAPPGSLRQRGCAGHDLTLRPGPGIREAWPLPGRGGSAPRPGEGGVRSAARDPARLGRGQRVTSAGLLDEASDTVGVHPAVTSSGSSRIGVASEAETRHARSLFCSTQSTRSRSVPAGTVSRGRSTISVKRVTPS